jgi:hypothetical protein
MKLIEELNSLKSLIGGNPEKFGKRLNEIRENYKSEEDLKALDEFIRTGMVEMTHDLQEFNREVTLRMQLSEVAQMVSLSYIAKKYFNKTRSWFHQRISGHVVNGKAAKFTDEEIKTLNDALRDIGQKIGSTVISL